MTRHSGDLISPVKRWTLLAISFVATALLFWAPPDREHIGYTLPIAMLLSQALMHGFVFIASRLNRADVTPLERRLRGMIFTKA